MKVCTAIVVSLIVLASGCKSSSPDEAGQPNQVTPSEEAPQNSGQWTPPEGDGVTPAVEVAEASFHGPGMHLPRPSEVDGWHFIEEPSYYNDTNLYELIDGGAASYAQLGLVETAYGVFVLDHIPEAAGREVGLEIYIFHMTTQSAAAQKYTSDHEGSTCQPVEGLDDFSHCLTSSTIDVLVGPYYVRLVMDYPNLHEPMVRAAQAVVGRITAEINRAQ